MPGRTSRPSASLVMRFARSSSLTVLDRQPLARSSAMVVARSMVGIGTSVRGGDAGRVGGRRAIAIDGGADAVDVGDAGLGKAGQIVAASLDLEFEVARAPVDAERELGGDAPAEVLEAVVVGIPGTEDGRAEPLDVAVLVASGGSDVVGGDDSSEAVADGPEDQDDAEPGQLIVV